VIQQLASGIRFAVRVTPRGGRDAIEGWQQDASGQRYLKLRVRAAPEDGKANAAVEALLAKALKLPRKRLRISAGGQSRMKMIQVDGPAAELAARLGALGDKT
jgi:uncharacterized protein YggU (UPF0235/DUF167 family)